MARRTRKPAEGGFRPIVVDAAPDPNFRPIYVGGTSEATPVAATVEKPTTGEKED